MDKKVPNRKAGGLARAETLSPDERKASATIAAAKRWGTPIAKRDATKQIGSWIMNCAVLDDNRRVISQRSFMELIEMKRGENDGYRIALLVDTPFNKSQKIKDLLMAIRNPIKYIGTNGRLAYGYEGETVVEYCRAVLDLRRVGALGGAVALRYADAAERFLVSLATTGIVAIIDEATGYQYERAKDALSKILEEYIAKELQPWTKTFPEEFYEQIFRLRNWAWPPTENFTKLKRRPQIIGKWTDDFIYCRLAPGVRDELRDQNPKLPSGRRKHKHHQWLTGEIGHPKLRSHLEGVVRLQRGCKNWREFRIFLDRFYPRVDRLALGIEVQIVSKETSAHRKALHQNS